MTLKKKPIPRSYETFSSSSEPSDNSRTSNSDKTRISAGIEAQRLASQGLWSDNYINRTPLANASEMGTEAEAFSRDEDPADPPPIYTPSETTASTPPSPVVARSQPQPVREPRSSPEDVAYPAIPEEPQEEVPSSDPYASSPLLERAQPEPDVQPRRCSRRGNGQCKDRRRRFRRVFWFSCALALCLWLMLPALIGDRVLLLRLDIAMCD